MFDPPQAPFDFIIPSLHCQCTVSGTQLPLIKHGFINVCFRKRNSQPCHTVMELLCLGPIFQNSQAFSKQMCPAMGKGDEKRPPMVLAVLYL